MAITWALDLATPNIIQVNVGYEGSLQLGGDLTDMPMGSVQSANFPGGSNGENLIKKMAIIFENKADDYDCFEMETCAIRTEEDFIIFSFDNELNRGEIGFSNSSERVLSFVIMERISE